MTGRTSDFGLPPATKESLPRPAAAAPFALAFGPRTRDAFMSFCVQREARLQPQWSVLMFTTGFAIFLGLLFIMAKLKRKLMLALPAVCAALCSPEETGLLQPTRFDANGWTRAMNRRSWMPPTMPVSGHWNESSRGALALL
jgi:hypothetical protein